jgi:hypothetical protein
VDQSIVLWLVVAIAIAAANLPFLSERVFGLVPLKDRAAADGAARGKPLALRLVELLVLYFVVGLLARAMESRIGGTFAQNWEFYAITACLFLVLAFPGFVLRYLRKRRT